MELSHCSSSSLSGPPSLLLLCFRVSSRSSPGSIAPFTGEEQRQRRRHWVEAAMKARDPLSAWAGGPLTGGGLCGSGPQRPRLQPREVCISRGPKIESLVLIKNSLSCSVLPTK